jgi:hypothetical protein
VAQGVGPEFKPQYFKTTTKIMKLCYFQENTLNNIILSEIIKACFLSYAESRFINASTQTKGCEPQLRTI